jgi:hypothetical protein
MIAEDHMSVQSNVTAPEQPVDLESPLFASMRSGHNISEWMEYLPDECVETMIGMGWNYST